jgi:hypothetical protein
MKKILLILAPIAAIGLFGAGWYCGRQSGAKLAAELLQMESYNRAYLMVTESDVAIENLDSGRVEDAKYMLRLTQDGNILSLNSMTETPMTNASFAEMKALLEFGRSSQSAYGSERKSADKIFARIAANRAAHPWNYAGNLPHPADPIAAAKVDAILKRAAESQK